MHTENAPPPPLRQMHNDLPAAMRAAMDRNSADIFTAIPRGVDQWLWLVESHLQARS